MSTSIKRFAENVGDVAIMPADEDETAWVVSVTFKFADELQTRDLIEWFSSPGAALDAAIKWGKDRGLEVQWMAHKFYLIRPGELEDTPQ